MSMLKLVLDGSHFLKTIGVKVEEIGDQMFIIKTFNLDW